MNGSCAGGTGAFIDQMATLLKMGADEMDKAAQAATRTYTTASRCGVLPKATSSPSSTRAHRRATSRRRSIRPLSTRPLQVWHRAAPSRAISCISAAR